MSETDQHSYAPGDCGCSVEWQAPKPNGTCAFCGGWLPGERPRPFFASLATDEAQQCSHCDGDRTDHGLQEPERSMNPCPHCVVAPRGEEQS